MSKIKKINYQIETKSVNKKIVLLTDIHYHSKKEMKHLNIVLSTLQEMEYDYLCISGDLLDRSFIDDEEMLIEWLRELGKLSKVIIGLGNHDVVNDRKTFEYNFNKELFNKIRRIRNIHVLDNEDLVVAGIRFIGLTLPIDYYYRYKENSNYFMRFVNNEFPYHYDDKYNILLCHTPLPLTDKDTVAKTRLLGGIDLILCGHMHGGITPKFLRGLMRGRGFIGPSLKLFPNNSYGVLTNEKNKIIISSGVTTAAHSNMFSFTDELFLKEITIIDLIKKK